MPQSWPGPTLAHPDNSSGIASSCHRPTRLLGSYTSHPPFKSLPSLALSDKAPMQVPNSPPWLPPPALAPSHLAPVPTFLQTIQEGISALPGHSPPSQLGGVSHILHVSPIPLRLGSPTVCYCPGCSRPNHQALVTVMQLEPLLLVTNPSRAGMAWLPHHEIPRIATGNQGRPRP